MLIPENIIYHNIRSLLKLLETDYDNNTDKTKTILYDLFNKDDNGLEMKFNRFVYLDQAVQIFVKAMKSDQSRGLQVTMGYNTQRKGLPTIHILLPNENKYEIGLGMGEGYQDAEVDLEAGTRRTKFTNVQKSTYNLMITSDNSSELVLIYHTLKNTMFATFAAFELRGLRDIEFGGQDITFENDLMPAEVFHRNLTMTFFYESTVSSLTIEKIIKTMVFNGDVIDDEI